MMVADNGSDWFISGAPDERWNDDLLGEIKAIPGRHFEVVRTVDDNGDPIYPTTQSTVEKITNGNYSSTAYPNPFRDKTTITYILQQNSFVELSIVDIQGRKVETLIKNKLAKGEHQITYKRQNYASGLYFYILITRNKRETGKLVVVD